MTDNELRKHVFVFLSVVMAFGMFLFLWPSIQYVMFMRDCAPDMGMEYCQDLWRVGNE